MPSEVWCLTLGSTHRISTWQPIPGFGPASPPPLPPVWTFLRLIHMWPPPPCQVSETLPREKWWMDQWFPQTSTSCYCKNTPQCTNPFHQYCTNSTWSIFPSHTTLHKKILAPRLQSSPSQGHKAKNSAMQQTFNQINFITTCTVRTCKTLVMQEASYPYFSLLLFFTCILFCSLPKHMTIWLKTQQKGIFFQV